MDKIGSGQDGVFPPVMLDFTTFMKVLKYWDTSEAWVVNSHNVLLGGSQNRRSSQLPIPRAFPIYLI